MPPFVICRPLPVGPGDHRHPEAVRHHRGDRNDVQPAADTLRVCPNTCDFSARICGSWPFPGSPMVRNSPGACCEPLATSFPAPFDLLNNLLVLAKMILDRLKIHSFFAGTQSIDRIFAAFVFISAQNPQHTLLFQTSDCHLQHIPPLLAPCAAASSPAVRTFAIDRRTYQLSLHSTFSAKRAMYCPAPGIFHISPYQPFLISAWTSPRAIGTPKPWVGFRNGKPSSPYSQWALPFPPLYRNKLVATSVGDIFRVFWVLGLFLSPTSLVAGKLNSHTAL